MTSMTNVNGLGWTQKLCLLSDCCARFCSRFCCLTVVGGHEGDVVHVVLDVRRFAVQDGDGGDAPVDRVDLQPVGGVEHLGVPAAVQAR